jgi:glycosyltransferase involved in cell wall biosynthesis
VKIAWYSNSPKAPTGYGTQTAMMLPRLMADGHKVAVLGNWGHNAGVLAYDTPDGTVPIMPSGHVHYSLDVAADQARTWFAGEPGWIIALYDTWVYPAAFWDGLNIAAWAPIDHYPLPPKVYDWCSKHPTIAMSEFGQRALAESGIAATYIPHGIEREVWTPTPSDTREQMSVPADAFLVMMNAANIKAPHIDRKAWDANLRAFSMFAREHDDAYIFLNTDPTRQGGFPIQRFLQYANVPLERVRITDVAAYRNGMIPQANVAAMYTAADVLLSCSMGEGFGLPVAESMACGTPAIVTDFSAQPELVGETGWKVPWLPYWDEMQSADFAWPDAESIVDALEAAYAERGTPQAEARSLAAEARIRERYDADTVYEQRWRPFLAELEATLTAAPRTGMSRAAQKRERRNLRRAA